MSWASYRSQVVMTPAPNWATPLDPEFCHRRGYRAVSGIGRAWSQQAETGLAWEAEFFLEDRTAIFWLKYYFDYLKGRWGAFWAPTWQADVKVTAAIQATDTTLWIEDMGYEGAWAGYEVTGRYLMIRFWDGTQIYRRVTNWPTPGSLTLDAAVGRAVAEGELGSLLVSFLLFARFDQDELLIEYLTESKAKAKLRFRAIPAEAV